MYVSSVILVLLIGVVYSSNPIVKIQNGDVQGIWKVSSKGRIFASFQGIPYAQPPVGELRFQPAERFPPWTGVWNASAPRSKCLQYDPFDIKIYGSEDCLFLNIYTPRLEPTASLPVVVYFHGGAFMYGEGGFYGPALLMNKDLVVVTLNYRLGPLGFISTGDAAAPGNIGLKDQAFAIRWVKENIRGFGGNPDGITLLGQSAGGSSVHYHYISPLSQGLFTRGIALSGSAFAPWAFSSRPVQKAKTLGSLVGCPTNSSTAMMTCLMEKPGEDLVKAQAEMISWKVKMFTVFTPTVEPAGTPGAFLTEHPYLATNSHMKLAPLIISVTSEEGLYPAAAYQKYPDLLPDLAEHWDELCSSIFEYNETLPVSEPAVATEIKEYYLHNKTVSQKTFADLIEAHGDRLFAVPVAKLAQMHAASGQPTYLYQFRYRCERSLAHLMANNEENYGTSHGDDMIHIFDIDLLRCTAPDDLRMNDMMTDMVSSFAASGVPNLGDNITWQQMSPATFNYLEISSPDLLRMKANPDFGHRSFWDSIGFTENEKYDPSINVPF